MKAFADLLNQIDQTKSTREKVKYIKEYFEKTSPEDAAWGLYFLSGHKLKRLVGPSKLFQWCLDDVALPEWLVLESYETVGDIAETISLLIPLKEHGVSGEFSLSEWVEEKIIPLEDLDADEQKREILKYWKELDQQSIFLLNKILTGSFRIGVSHLLTIQALSQALKIDKETLSQRLMGSWFPSAEFFLGLKEPIDLTKSHLNPYPFYLASPVEEPLENMGPVEDWIAEWKWDGIRAQCIFRGGIVAIWSRGNALITHQFPEIAKALEKLDHGIVVDGEILAYIQGKPLPFSELQKRLGRKKVTKSVLESVPIVFMIYDIIEEKGQDIRKMPFIERRKIFEHWNIDERLLVSPKIEFKNWDELREKRLEASSNSTEGLILKRKNSHYGVGRRRGNWWKYKIDPKTIDAVLIYAQPGHGWRANLYTDYTFGVWSEDELVPIAKAYSGLSKDEIYELDRWIRKNTIEKFGPVRRVKQEMVFEIAFEGIQKSPRHKSGVALRFPRIVRWRTDKTISECDNLRQIKFEFLFDQGLPNY